MGKGDIKIKKIKSTEEMVTHEPRLSDDKKTLVLVQETTTPATYADHLYLALAWINMELEEIDGQDDATLQ